MNKEEMFRKARMSKILARYINLPCILVSLISAGYAFHTGNSGVFLINGILALLNYGLFLLNSSNSDKFTEIAEIYANTERMEKVNKLNPFK